MLPPSLAARIAVPCLIAACVGCSRYSDELREWRASDHDHTSEPGAQGAVAPGASANIDRAQAAAALAEHGIDEATLTTWTRECAPCHGVIGRGDGPRAAMTGAKDLSRPEWHASVSDQQIADVIRQGRGQMPPFALPATTIQGLVRLVRLMDRDRGSRAPAGSAEPPSSAAPTGPSAAPAVSAAPSTASAARPAPIR